MALGYSAQSLDAPAGSGWREASVSAEKMFGFDSRAAQFCRDQLEQKAAVAPQLTTSDGGALLRDDAGSEFISAVIDASVVGQMPELRRMPLATRVLASTSNATAAFLGEGNPAPLGQMTMTGSFLDSHKISAAVVVSKELLLSASPDAEKWLTDELVGACRNGLNAAFFDPANAGSASVSPASVTNGLSAVSPTADAGNDLQSLVTDFGGDLAASYFVARPEVFAAISGRDRPNVGLRGGELLGAPALATRDVPTSGGQHIILIDPSGVGFGVGGVSVVTSTAGTAIMADNPSSPAQQVSLWQSGAVGIRVDIHVNWIVLRPSCVKLISGASY